MNVGFMDRQTQSKHRNLVKLMRNEIQILSHSCKYVNCDDI